jgi:ferredoxin-NADP reductase
VRTPGSRSGRRVDGAITLLALGAGLLTGVAWITQEPGFAAAPGGWLTFIGRLTGLLGTYTALVSIALSARLPWVERRLGHDRLVHAHRRLGTATLALLIAHATFITAGYAAASGTSLLGELWTIVTTYPEMLKGTAGFLLFLGVGVLAVPVVRRRIRYATWWVLHLATYLAVVLAWGHQLATGTAFVGHQTLSLIWTAMTYGVAVLVVYGRLLVPALRSLRHQVRVHSVVREGPGIISVYVTGRNLAALDVHGGQYFLWRFLTPELWWRAHPYSVSSGPNGRFLRLTVREVGEHSSSLAALHPGTRVFIEGPYGRFHAAEHGELADQPLLLIAGGVGVAPVRAILEELGPRPGTVVLYRVRHRDDVLFHDEFARMVSAYGATVQILAGSRHEQPMTARRLRQLVPDVAHRTLFVCGPGDLVEGVRRAGTDLGIDPDRIHAESFAFLPA